MKITALVENTSNCDANTAHGLSLYIETEKHKVLFDVGPDNTLFYNSRKLGIDLSKIDTVVISHGHSDHGGALEQFLKINNIAKIYVQGKAFDKHYLKVLFLKVSVGLSADLRTHPQMVLLDGDYTIDDELSLFTVPNTLKCRSTANDVLYTKDGKDCFAHEQNLIISDIINSGSRNVLIIGCGHAGVVNILEKAAARKPEVCVGGYHLWNPVSKKNVSDELLEEIAKELAKHRLRYYTCHCTGKNAYNYLSARLPNMSYLSCGEVLEI